MLFTHETNADQFDLFSYGNLRLEANNQHSSCTEMNLRGTNTNSRVTVTGIGKENVYGKSEESSFGNSLKDGSSVSHGNFSFSWLAGDDFQPTTLDHDKRPHSDTRSCQIACKRPKQTDISTWSYSFEEHPFSNAVEISSSVLADECGESRQSDNMSAQNGTRTSNDSSEIPCSNQVQSSGLESLNIPDWVTFFPGYFEDCGIVDVHDTVDHIDSPVQKYFPRKEVPIGPEHQADIPEWRLRVSEIVPCASCSYADTGYSVVSTSEFVLRDDDSESDKWVCHCVVPMPTSPFDSIGDNNVDCECSDEGSVRCARQHISEARESLKMSLGPDKFRDLGLSEMGEDVAQRWTNEENRFQREVFAYHVSLGKNFWDYLPHAFPGKSSKELVSYYFNVFMLRKRAQQNRSDQLRVDSDDDELPDEPSITQHGEEDSTVEEFSSHEHFINDSMSIEGVHEESEGECIHGVSLHAGECGYSSNQMP
ncbi:hypothetical protein QOZ80_3BG0274870 [Eleusine coracana subsp. coracana]|nr:hypothetical protein QOZ80_3BG0274870 [Eleusine coracana subsp. coracana]